MSYGRSDLIDIECMIMRDRPEDDYIAIADGTEEIYKGKKKLKWFFLSRSVAHDNEDGTVSIPENVAREKGLI